MYTFLFIILLLEYPRLSELNTYVFYIQYIVYIIQA
jgi:hypothetical protein